MPTPSANVTFGSGGSAVTVPGPPTQTDVNNLAQWITDSSANHTRWSYKLTGTAMYQWSIPLTALSGAQKVALQSFFTTTVGGPTSTFTYTHTDGNSYTVRFIDTSLSWSRVNGEMWDVTVRLETATQPA